MLEQAHDARRRVLSDMAQRRRAVMLQIEQFRAARDQVAASVVAVRREFDRILNDLSRAEDEAREAAAEVGRQGLAQPEGDLVAEAEEAVAGLPLEPVPAPEEPSGAWGEGEPATAPGEETGVLPVLDLASENPPSPLAPSATGEAHEETTGAEAGALGLSLIEPSAPVPWTAAEPAPEAAHDSVEGLFARLRAGRDQDAEPAPFDAEVESAPTGVEQQAATPAPTVEEGLPAETPPADTGEIPSVGPTDAVPPATPEAGVAETPEGEAPPTPGPDDEARARRAELLDPIVVKLSRRLKRVLQDDQNRVLDRLRAGSGAWSGDVLASEDEHRREFVAAAAPHLDEAMKAGMTFARHGGRAPRPTGADREVLAELADGLAGTVVTLLRRRMAEQEEAMGEEDPTERVGAAYREWRGERIERLVGDYALGAFSTGVLRGAGRGGQVRWVLAGTGKDCADCEDNALADTLDAGAEFPTGHRYPPAHAGCRCLVVPTVV